MMQILLLLVAPALFAASIYMALGRIISLVDGEDRSIIKRRWLTKIFVAGDVLSFVLQGAGVYFSFPSFHDSY
jgi:RTA1 like protein